MDPRSPTGESGLSIISAVGCDWTNFEASGTVLLVMRWSPLASILVVALLMSSCTDASDQPSVKPSRIQAVTADADADASKKCSRKEIRHERKDVRAVAFARGTGPVFVGLGTAHVVRYTEDTREDGGWYYNKTLWAISPKYERAVTVTGEQVDGPNELRFNAATGSPGEKLTALEFDEADTAEWRYGPSDTLIPADGCYAFRIEGEDFVEWVTFIARS
jgi:hypothetical protein